MAAGWADVDVCVCRPPSCAARRCNACGMGIQGIEAYKTHADSAEHQTKWQFALDNPKSSEYTCRPSSRSALDASMASRVPLAR